MVRRVPNAQNVIVTGTETRFERFEAHLPVHGQDRARLNIRLVDNTRKVGKARETYLTLDEVEALRDLLNAYFPKTEG